MLEENNSGGDVVVVASQSILMSEPEDGISSYVFPMTIPLAKERSCLFEPYIPGVNNILCFVGGYDVLCLLTPISCISSCHRGSGAIVPIPT